MLSALASLLGRWRTHCLRVFFNLFAFVQLLSGWRGTVLVRGSPDAHDSPEARQARIAHGRKRRLDENGYVRATEDQDLDIIKAFVESIDKDAVCALASRFNHGAPCHIVDRLRGSFNFCFFVEFDKQDGERGEPTKWVVRLPIGHTVARPWDKVVSEVTTMRYLQQNTNIPIPRVHAFGREPTLIRKEAKGNADSNADGGNSSSSETGSNGAGSDRTSGGQIYVIMDYVAGANLDKKLLTTADPEHRRHFYLQLVDILMQLRTLEFPRIGSLVPSTDDVATVSSTTTTTTTTPLLGPMLSMSDNILCLPPPPLWTSATDYMRHEFDVVSDFFFAPIGSLKIETAREELFALAGLKPLFADLFEAVPDSGPFVLNHCDMRSTNLIVDEQLRIQAVIDWEFTTAIPLPLFTPPSWITGHNDYSETNPLLHTEFREALHSRSRENPACRKLEIEWYGEEASSAADTPISPTSIKRFAIAHILQKPPHAVEIFYKFLAGDDSSSSLHIIDEEKEARIAKYLEDHPEVEAEAQRRCDQSRAYRKYLEDNGIFESRMDRIRDMEKKYEEKVGRRLFKK